jgi:hypothetical protein
LGMVWVPARLDTATKILKEKFKIQTLSSWWQCCVESHMPSWYLWGNSYLRNNQDLKQYQTEVATYQNLSQCFFNMLLDIWKNWVFCLPRGFFMIHKYSPWRIYVLGYIVPHRIFKAIECVVANLSI